MQAMRWTGIGVLGAACLCGGAAIAADDKPAKANQRGEAKGDARDVKVNIKAVSKADLTKLDGIGAGAAQKIIAYRQTGGPFNRPQDRVKVDGLAVKNGIEKNAGGITAK